jgi:uncharacterized protein (UPF0261 family)
MPKTIALIATLDTRAGEIHYMKKLVRDRGHNALVIDVGILGEPPYEPDVKREDLMREIGLEVGDLLALEGQEGKASRLLSRALVSKIKKLLENGAIDGVIAIGGGMGSAIVAEALQALPIGFPKVLVSTKAIQGGIRQYAGSKDVVIIPPVCDISGLNRITERILCNAVGSVIGMVEMPPIKHEFKEKLPVIMSANGAIGACALALKNMLEKDRHEVIVFHTIGPGGRAMEDYIKDHDVGCCLELALCEIGNELFGGLASAGPDRLEAAGLKGIPQIIAVGAVEFINFLGPSSIPEPYRGRRFHAHNEQAHAMRIVGEEVRTLAGVMAEKLNRAKGRTEVVIPLKGFSKDDKEGGPFWDPESDAIFIKTLKENLSSSVRVFELDMNITDIRFAEFLYGRFREAIGSAPQ